MHLSGRLFKKRSICENLNYTKNFVTFLFYIFPLLKKLAAILLITLFLFNWFGYRLLTDYLETVAVTSLQVKLDDNHYDAAQLISIKVPLQLPYGSNNIKYDAVEGNIDVNGISYQYVKRRILRDTLELLCIPNTARTGIMNARDEFSKLASDFINFNTTTKNTGTHSHSVKQTTVDYTSDHAFDLCMNSISGIAGFNYFPNIDHSSNAVDAPDRPPEC